MLSMCLLFCFVLFWIFCYVVCEKIKIKIVDNKKKETTYKKYKYKKQLIYSSNNNCCCYRVIIKITEVKKY